VPWRDGRTFRTVFSLAFGTLSRDWIAAVSSLVRGKRVRGWNRLCLAASRNPSYYRRWIEVAEPRVVEAWCGGGAPNDISERVTCLVIGCNGNEDLAALTAHSLKVAFGDAAPVWTDGVDLPGCTPLASEAQASTQLAIECLAGEDAERWIIAVRAGDLVSPHLGSALDRGLRECGGSSVIFWDEDSLENGVRNDPWIKGDWDELIYLARDTLSGACALSGPAARAAAARETDTPLNAAALAILAAHLAKPTDAQSPHHLPLILTHRDGGRGLLSPQEWKHVAASCWHGSTEASVRSDGLPFLRIAPPPPERWPSVSIIIPTRDQADLLAACLTGLSSLDYAGAVEILVVDNGSTQPEALRLFEELAADGRARVLPAPGAFNFSALNNQAAREARGEFLCLLNNDVEALDGEWLTAMMRHAVRPGAGAVGALLLYPDGSVQHAGVAIGIGGAAGHVARGAMPGDHRHAAWHAVTRRVAAVTAACLLVRRECYLESGGLDEAAFPVAFNDVDFCLRLQASGLQNILAVEAQLIHHESRSRGSDFAPKNARRFARELNQLHERWHTQQHVDPHYSPLFSRTAESCLLAF
jgi:GT2 family glycosyltransferase